MIYFAFIFGVVFGSFINVVIYRLKNGRNIIFGRSFCPECKTQLRWHDLIPVLSFIWLRGHCRYCRKKISWQYPIVEILSGLIWLGVFYKVFYFNFQPPLSPLLIKEGIGVVFNSQFLNFIYYIFIFSALLIIAVYDFKWKIIPDKIVYPAIVATLIFNVSQTILPPLVPPLNKGGLGGLLLTASIAFLFFFSIFYFSKGRAMGLGDAKLAFLILFLNFTEALMAFVLAFIIGAVFGIILMTISKIPNSPFYQKWAMKSQIAFGPFLVIGVAVTFFFPGFIFKILNLLNF